MERRSFIKQAGLAGILAAGSAPAFAQGAPEIKWRLASSFPRSLDTLFGGAELIAKRVAASTGNKFQIQAFAGGEIVPAFGVVDAVQNATVQCAHTAPYYFFGKDPTFAFGCTIPFGMNTRQQNAWMYHGGGLELMREFYKDYNIINFPAGNTTAQMGGFYRKPIKTVADFKGLKMRIGGTGGLPLQKLGVIPQQIPGGDIYPALEKGTIDAAEWVGPYDDEKLGLYKVAKYYYYPGWWEGQAEFDLFVNIKAWNDLPKEYQSILESACAETNIDMIAKYDALNPPALKRLIAAGVKLEPFSNEIMAACYKATIEVYDEIASKNPKFKKVYEPWKAFRDQEIAWFQVAENRFDNFMIATLRMQQARK
ncbi:MAG: TRAP transporter substrate-binding protein DctP [Proteobacteria bacterium]|jgi:TRAP-type mannitol/chloroaromatic compound transport system substrate-binding protein|nr:TRAP transporter substrate-binding protein DctP [Pseudomonadota bacterium]